MKNGSPAARQSQHNSIDGAQRSGPTTGRDRNMPWIAVVI